MATVKKPSIHNVGEPINNNYHISASDEPGVRFRGVHQVSPGRSSESDIRTACTNGASIPRVFSSNSIMSVNGREVERKQRIPFEHAVGNVTALPNSASSDALVNLALKKLSGRLNVRSFEAKDAEQIRSVCFSHFRSSYLAAVRFYIAEHLQDLVFLVVLAKCFLPWKQFFVAVGLFHLYLVVRARLQTENYIRQDCTDLKDIQTTYMSCGPAAHFWVAELISTSGNEHPESSLNNKGTSSATTPEPLILGCVGLIRSREDESLAKVVRLVVRRSHRRLRIGSRLLSQLENFAEEIGYSGLRMYTNTLNPTHVKFVRQHGFTLVQTIRRGLMRGDLITWHKPLRCERDDFQPSFGVSRESSSTVLQRETSDSIHLAREGDDVLSLTRTGSSPRAYARGSGTYGGGGFHSVAQTVMD